MTQDRPVKRVQMKLTNVDQLYAITDEQGNSIDYKQADGRQLFNHYRHKMTNYDQFLDDMREQQAGHLKGIQQKQATERAAELILEKYREEHVQVIVDGQKKGDILKSLMQKAGVGTASALIAVLDSYSEKLKTFAHLERSQRELQKWNDTYRVQKELVKQVLSEAAVDPDVQQRVNAVYATKSVNKAIEAGSTLLNWEKSEILRLVKTAVRYTKLS
jgi:hypothetical protein